MYSMTDHVLGHKAGLRKVKTTEIISSMFSDHNTVEIKNKLQEKTIKNTNMWRLNNMLLNN